MILDFSKSECIKTQTVWWLWWHSHRPFAQNKLHWFWRRSRSATFYSGYLGLGNYCMQCPLLQPQHQFCPSAVNISASVVVFLRVFLSSSDQIRVLAISSQGHNLDSDSVILLQLPDASTVSSNGAASSDQAVLPNTSESSKELLESAKTESDAEEEEEELQEQEDDADVPEAGLPIQSSKLISSHQACPWQTTIVFI